MKLLLTGSIAYDYLMKFPGYFRDHILPEQLEFISLSFLVESMVRQRGGIAPNIAYTMALLGGRPSLLATAGEDFEEYRLYLENLGVDTSCVRIIPGEFTATYFANTDLSNAQIASFYPGAMAYAGQLSLRDLDALPDYVVISPNEPEAMVRYVDECQELSVPYLYDPSQQIPRLSDEALQRGVEGAHSLFVNQYESYLIQKRTGLAVKELLADMHYAVVTYGKEGSVVYTNETERCIPSVEPERIVDPTGVGDAFRGGFLTGYLHHFDLETCGQIGALAATYCLEQQGPQGHHFTPAEFIARFRRHFDDGGVLDALIQQGDSG
jgi:adenosine kinase